LFEIQVRLATIESSISLASDSVPVSAQQQRLPPYNITLSPAPSKTREHCWTHAEYIKAEGHNATSPVYFKNSQGGVLGQAFNQAVSTFVRARWITLGRCGALLDLWDQADSETLDFVYIPTCATFPEVRLCELNWKLRQWCIDKFPSWRRGWLAKSVPAPAPTRLERFAPHSAPTKRLRSASTTAEHEAERPSKVASKTNICIIAIFD
jgi:hypothetical protein